MLQQGPMQENTGNKIYKLRKKNKQEVHGP